ncbi:hypothetical protein UFOVP347_26 [uncultured Caudovirales phage]|uniref:Uncharacterized protein n=1 Tax=uncultured Caudovirales phage TaxID=2100421 RepID=A0A6J5LZW2_9CAUD|nr:hypothetical protein UFOVP347_26 [uncultured Caudovirales phage]
MPRKKIEEAVLVTAPQAVPSAEGTPEPAVETQEAPGETPEEPETPPPAAPEPTGAEIVVSSGIPFGILRN